MNSTIDNSDKVIDSRDIIKRIEELESERESCVTEEDAAREAYEEAIQAKIDAETDESLDTSALDDTSDRLKEELESAKDSLVAWDDSEEAEELKILKALADQCEGYGDWADGETLIHDNYFEAYAKELAEDCGMIDKKDIWPNRCIDWAQAAEELKQDYMEVDFDGETYWMRA